MGGLCACVAGASRASALSPCACQPGLLHLPASLPASTGSCVTPLAPAPGADRSWITVLITCLVVSTCVLVSGSVGAWLHRLRTLELFNEVSRHLIAEAELHHPPRPVRMSVFTRAPPVLSVT